MIIKSIELKNIRTYSHKKIDLDFGINFLQGDIGSGKSTILMALEFALFGFIRGQIEGFHILSKGKDKGFVSVIFSLEDDTEIEITRQIKRNKNGNSINQHKVFIRVNENIEELSPTELNSKVYEIFNLPKYFINKNKNLIYRFTNYTAQEQLKEILFSNPDERLQVIRKIFKIDKYKQLNEAIEIYQSHINSNKRVKKTQFEEITISKDSIKEIDLKIKNIQIEIKKENEKLKKLEEHIKSKRIKKTGIEDRLKLLQEKNLIVEKELSKIEEIELQIKKYENVILLKNKNKDKNEVLEKLNSQIKIKDCELEKRQKFLLDFKKEDITNKEAQLKERVESLSKKIQEYISMEDKIKIHKENLNIEEIKENILKLKSEYKDHLEEYNKNVKLVENKDVFKEELKATENKINLLNEEFKQIDKKREKLKKQDKCTECHQEISKEHKEKTINNYSKRQEEIKNDLKILNEETNKQKEGLENIKLIIEKQDKLKEKISLVKFSLKSLIDDYNKQKDKLKIIEDLKFKLKELEIVSLEESQKKLEELNKNLKDISQNLKERQKREIEENRKIDEIKLDLEKIKNKILNIQREEEELKKLKIEILELKNKIKNKHRNLELKEKLNKLLNKEKEILKEEEICLSKLQTEEREIFSNKNSKIVELEYLKKEFENSQKQVEKKEIIKKELLRIDELNKFLDNIKINVSGNIERILFRKYYIEFNENFSKIFSELIDNSQIDVRLDENFSPIIEQSGFDLDVKNLSGGEKSSLAISYKFALKKVIESNIKNLHFDFLVLDEPSDGFSENQINKLSNILKTSNSKQIIIVSHDEKLEAISHHTIFIEKIGGNSQIRNG
jgi:DNA repair protein SbcC/Rad50